MAALSPGGGGPHGGRAPRAAWVTRLPRATPRSAAVGAPPPRPPEAVLELALPDGDATSLLILAWPEHPDAEHVLCGGASAAAARAAAARAAARRRGGGGAASSCATSNGAGGGAANGAAPPSGARPVVAAAGTAQLAFGRVPHGARVVAAAVPLSDLRATSASGVTLHPHTLLLVRGRHPPPATRRSDPRASGGACPSPPRARTPPPPPARVVLRPAPEGGPAVAIPLAVRRGRAAAPAADAAATGRGGARASRPAPARAPDGHPLSPPTVEWRFHFGDDRVGNNWTLQTVAGWCCALCGLRGASGSGLVEHVRATHHHLDARLRPPSRRQPGEAVPGAIQPYTTSAPTHPPRIDVRVKRGALDAATGQLLPPSDVTKAGGGSRDFVFIASAAHLAARERLGGGAASLTGVKRRRWGWSDAEVRTAKQAKLGAAAAAAARAAAPLPRPLRPSVCYHARTAVRMRPADVVAIMGDPTCRPDSDDEGDDGATLAAAASRDARVLARRAVGLAAAQSTVALAWDAAVRVLPLVCDRQVPSHALAFAHASAPAYAAGPADVAIAYVDHFITLSEEGMLPRRDLAACLKILASAKAARAAEGGDQPLSPANGVADASAATPMEEGGASGGHAPSGGSCDGGSESGAGVGSSARRGVTVSSGEDASAPESGGEAGDEDGVIEISSGDAD